MNKIKIFLILISMVVSPIFFVSTPATAAATCTHCKIFAYYYPWYGTAADNWRNWRITYPGGTTPYLISPDDVHSMFYPASDPYSSKDTTIIDQHLSLLNNAHVGVVLYAWWGVGSYPDTVASTFMARVKSQSQNMRVAFVIDKYDGRTIGSVKNDIKHIIDTYVNNAQYGDIYLKIKRFSQPYPRRPCVKVGVPTTAACPSVTPTSAAQERPVIYVFASNQFTKGQWQGIIGNRSSHSGSLRQAVPAVGTAYNGTEPYNPIVIGSAPTASDVKTAGFDGIGMYSAREDWASQYSVWDVLFHDPNNGMNGVVVAPVGPGKRNPVYQSGPSSNPQFCTTLTRFSDRKSIQHSQQQYSDRFHEASVSNSGVDWVSIISFNEFHEGTQIEPAKVKTNPTGRILPCTTGPTFCAPGPLVYCNYIGDYGSTTDANSRNVYMNATTSGVTEFESNH